MRYILKNWFNRNTENLWKAAWFLCILYICTCIVHLSIYYKAHGQSTQAFTTHEIRAAKDGGGDWRLTSITQEMSENEIFIRLPHILTFRNEDGIWKETHPGIPGSELYKELRKQTQRIIKALDLIVPKEEIISICYWGYINEVVIYFHVNRWEDEKFHRDIIKELNKVRRGNII